VTKNVICVAYHRVLQV